MNYSIREIANTRNTVSAVTVLALLNTEIRCFILADTFIIPCHINVQNFINCNYRIK
jgi:hypothetical protein